MKTTTKKLYFMILLFLAFGFSCKKNLTKEEELSRILVDYEKLIDKIIDMNTKLCDPTFNISGEFVAQVFQVGKKSESIEEELGKFSLEDYTPEQLKTWEKLQKKINDFNQNKKYSFFQI